VGVGVTSRSAVVGGGHSVNRSAHHDIYVGRWPHDAADNERLELVHSNVVHSPWYAFTVHHVTVRAPGVGTPRGHGRTPSPEEAGGRAGGRARYVTLV
jgi:hypothetical protein